MTPLVKSSKPSRRAIVEAVVCAVPALAALEFGSPRAAAFLYFGLFAALLLIHVISHNRFAMGSLIVATIPLMMLLRGGFFYSSVVAVLGFGVLAWILLKPSEMAVLWSDKLTIILLVGLAGYWLLSAVVNSSYLVNVRALELALSAANVRLLSQNRKALHAALLGIGSSTVLIGLALMPYGGRLGAATVGQVVIGNPISFGLPAALLLILSVADGGRWLSTGTYVRPLLGAIGAILLLLSASRGSWLVAAISLMILLSLNPPARKALAILLPAFVLLAVGVFTTQRGQLVGSYFEKMVTSGRSLEQRSSGRAEQWLAAPKLLADSPVWGFGLGSGRSVSYEYTGVGRIWHSLYLHLLAESGLLGLLALLAILCGLLHRGIEHRRLTGEIVPLLGTVGFMSIGLTVNAFDGISGVYLGLGLLAGHYHRYYIVRRYAAVMPPGAAPMRLDEALV